MKFNLNFDAKFLESVAGLIAVGCPGLLMNRLKRFTNAFEMAL
jgi:hypothetical protein